MSLPLSPNRNIDQVNSRLAKEADDKAIRWHMVFAGRATPEQAARVLEDLRRITMADECPAHAAGYDTNRTFTITGRQAVWREIQHILANKPPQL